MSVAGWVWFYGALNAGLTAAASAISDDGGGERRFVDEGRTRRLGAARRFLKRVSRAACAPRGVPLGFGAPGKTFRCSWRSHRGRRRCRPSPDGA